MLVSEMGYTIRIEEYMEDWNEKEREPTGYLNKFINQKRLDDVIKWHKEQWELRENKNRHTARR